MKKICLITLLTLFSILFCSISFLYIKGPIINIKDEVITINWNTPYQEKDIKAHHLYQDLTDKIVAYDNIDIKKIGTYKITYILNYHKKEYKKTRTVHVKDIEKPNIILTNLKNSYACPNQEYKEAGVKAIDNYDGDITNKISVSKTKTEWIYKVTDSSGNTTTKTRKIEYKDMQKPTIQLKGEKNISIYVGSNYQEPGYKVIDNCDQELEKEVTVTGKVDTSKIGKYTITYQVKDKSGNQEETTRIVSVKQKPVFLSKTIYLTFDDGPSPNITPQILDILKEENVKATFFVTNQSGMANLIKRAHQEGHTVAIHTASHNFYEIYKSEKAFWTDIEKMNDLIEQATGQRSKIFRFAGGSSNTISRFNPGIMTRLTKQANQKGYTYFDWSIDSDDAGSAHTIDQVYNNVIKSLGYQYSNMVLMHDSGNKYATLGALKKIIQYGKNMGFTFAPITDSTPPVHHRINN